jgi:hypothetical protein
MAYIVNFDQSNKADFTFDVTATDVDTGLAIDFTGALVTHTIKDENDCQVLTSTIGSGITQPVGTTIEVKYPASQMEGLRPGSYKHGMVYHLNGEINPLLTGTLSIYDGVAQI